ncbi:hypothetical protein B0A55_12861 [Friedmanniomyces simplex]|uniref:HMG box domain-containing protein n=1 Tax=Friedmanniomyces simplex TaxID=329884 RepID=A0A4U0WBU4_9PEZI|nr:hypothetical protein B0A55_12861 [Friedmanniomyces simplex]
MGPMPPKQKVTKQTLANAGQATVSKGAADKVPRPPNAFIIYRKDWHSTVVAQNPGVHNNSISVIIGEKWRGESKEVREIYRGKAEDAKRQHELNHPEYQYQPRKPSEKKRRMTKSKLAKLAKAEAEANGYAAEQQSLPDDFDPAILLDENLGNHTASRPMQLTNFGTEYTPQQPLVQRVAKNACTTFESGPDLEGRLLAGLQQFNEQVAAQTQSAAPALTVNNNVAALWNTAGMPVPVPTIAPGNAQAPRPRQYGATLAQPMVNGQLANQTPSFAYPTNPQTQAFAQQPWRHDVTAYSNNVNHITSAPRSPVPARGQEVPTINAFEILRQDVLDVDFGTFIDMNAFGSSPSPTHVGPAGFDVDAAFAAHIQPQTAFSVPGSPMREDNMPETTEPKTTMPESTTGSEHEIAYSSEPVSSTSFEFDFSEYVNDA